MLSDTTCITDSTIVQNIAIIADSIIITLQIQIHESLKPYKLA
jgi:hypothetical protein